LTPYIIFATFLTGLLTIKVLYMRGRDGGGQFWENESKRKWNRELLFELLLKHSLEKAYLVSFIFRQLLMWKINSHP